MQFFTAGAQNLKALNLTEILQDLFIVLNNREKEVLIRRFALAENRRETLESIGQDLAVTRERVRQIENLAIKKLQRTCPTTAFNLINQTTINLLKEYGGVMTENELISKLIKELNHNSETETSIIQLSLNINPELKKIKKAKTTKASWHLKSIDKKSIKTIVTQSLTVLKEKGEVIEESQMIKLVQQELAKEKLSINPKTIASAIAIDNRIKLIPEGFGLTKWRHVEPKSIRDKALIILRRQNKPLHFVEIANEISAANFSKKQVTTQAVHNELIRYDDFVLVGRGLYALKEWGYSKGTVRDVLIEVLKEGGKMKKQDIIKAVLDRRHVKIGTISLNLQKYPEFERVGRALYQYNQSLAS